MNFYCLLWKQLLLLLQVWKTKFKNSKSYKVCTCSSNELLTAIMSSRYTKNLVPVLHNCIGTVLAQTLRIPYTSWSPYPKSFEQIISPSCPKLYPGKAVDTQLVEYYRSGPRFSAVHLLHHGNDREWSITFRCTPRDQGTYRRRVLKTLLKPNYAFVWCSFKGTSINVFYFCRPSFSSLLNRRSHHGSQKSC